MAALNYKTQILTLDEVMSGDNIDLSGVDQLKADAAPAESPVPSDRHWDVLPDAAGALG